MAMVVEEAHASTFQGQIRHPQQGEVAPRRGVLTGAPCSPCQRGDTETRLQYLMPAQTR